MNPAYEQAIEALTDAAADAAKVAAHDDPGSDRVAERFLLQARELRLQSELEMLEQDQLSQSVRRNLQQLQEELLTRQVENTTASVAAYQALMTESVTRAAKEIVASADESTLDVPQDDQEAVELAAEVRELGLRLESVIQDLVVARREVLDKLHKLYLELIPMLASLESETNMYLDAAREIRADMTQQPFWIRSSPALSINTLRELPGRLSRVFSRDHWVEAWGAMKMDRAPATPGGLLLLAVVLLILRFRIGAALPRTGEGIRRVSTDRIMIPGGVAYGSDTTKARQIRDDVASDHPRLREDPAPTASFEQFADSTLNRSDLNAGVLQAQTSRQRRGSGNDHLG